MGRRSLSITWLVLLVSKQSLMSPEGSGTMTTGLTLEVGPSAGSIISWLTSFSSF